MIYRKLGNTDIELSAITFGAWAIGGFMWGGSDENEAIKAIQHGWDIGVTSIDTAPVYGLGLSEELVGQAIKGKRDKFQILTKFVMKWQQEGNQTRFRTQKDYEDLMKSVYTTGKKDSVMKECEDSLRRLGTDYIDYYQMHWPVEDAPIEETMEALEKLQDQGKIRAAGVCNFSADQLAEAEKHFELQGNQVPYSMVNRGIEEDVVPYAQKHGKSIIAYSPMQRGLLTGKFSPDHQFSEGDHRAGHKYFRKENIEKVNTFLESLRPIAERHNAKMNQIVLNWTINQPGISVALAGSRNADQIEENAMAAKLNLSDSEMKQINDGLAKLNLNLA